MTRYEHRQPNGIRRRYLFPLRAGMKSVEYQSGMSTYQRAYCIVTTVLSLLNLAVIALAVWGSRKGRG